MTDETPVPAKAKIGRPTGQMTPGRKDSTKLLAALKRKALKLYGVKDFDPLYELMRMGFDPQTSEPSRVRCFETISRYVHHQKSAITFPEGVPMVGLSHEQWLEMLG